MRLLSSMSFSRTSTTAMGGEYCTDGWMTCAVETSRKVVDSILVAASGQIGVGKLSREAHNEYLFDGLPRQKLDNPSQEVTGKRTGRLIM